MSIEDTNAFESVSQEAKFVVRFALDRMIRSLYGELNLLAQRCLGHIGSGDQRSIIFERYDLWRSCVLVAQEALKTLDAPKSVMQKSAELLSEINSIREAFDLLINAKRADRNERKHLCDIFTHSYANLRKITDGINGDLNLQMQFFDKNKNLARVLGERSLQWLCRDLLVGSGGKQEKGAQSNGGGTNST